MNEGIPLKDLPRWKRAQDAKREAELAHTAHGNAYNLRVTYRPGKRQIYTAIHNGKPLVSGSDLDEVCKIAGCMIDGRELLL